MALMEAKTLQAAKGEWRLGKIWCWTLQAIPSKNIFADQNDGLLIRTKSTCSQHVRITLIKSPESHAWISYTRKMPLICRGSDTHI